MADLVAELCRWIFFAWELGLIVFITWIWLCILGPDLCDSLANVVFFGGRRSTSRRSIYPTSEPDMNASTTEVRRG